MREGEHLQRSLVHLVNHHVAHTQEVGVASKAPQEDSSGAEREAGVGSDCSIKTHVVPNPRAPEIAQAQGAGEQA